MSEWDLLVLGDCNPDLILTGDVEPTFGQVETLLDSADLTVGGSRRHRRVAWRDSDCEPRS